MTRVHNHVVNPIIILETLMVYTTHFWQNWGWFIYYWIPHILELWMLTVALFPMVK